MNGVQIVNEFEVAAETVFNWETFWIGGLLGLIIGFIVFLCMTADEYIPCIIGLTVSIVISLFIAFMGGILVPKVTTYETHYEVIIDESVSMPEFLDKYEILDTRGKILTVREKDSSSLNN